MKRFLPILCAILCLMVCVPVRSEEKPLDRDGYVDCLYRYMPLPDSLVHPRSFWEEAVEKTLAVREKMAWGVPEAEFRHFVLPLRVNNEDLDRFRVLYADELCERVKGMSMHDAVLEINHWCHEWATYIGTDARTRGPLALMASGLGRCGEESTFTVSALRAAGIPARQVYTPLWAHTDSNHAWVEAWVDGSWHFLGACEPEPELDMGWFNAAVSRALLLHTKVSGGYEGPEETLSRNPVYTEINLTRDYVPVRRAAVTVRNENGEALRGIEVEFKVFNYGAFSTVARIPTDETGRACLETGLGDMLVWASDGAKFGFAKLDRGEVTLVLDHFEGEVFAVDLDMVPPAEHPLPVPATEAQIAANFVRLAREDSLRAVRHKTDNAKLIADTFLEAVSRRAPKQADAAAVLVSGLARKDKGDVSQEVLWDALESTETIDPMLLEPRVSTEMLYPCRKEIRAALKDVVHTPAELAQWVKDNIAPIDPARNPQHLRIPPLFVWRSRMSDPESADIFFVAACRALGWPALIDKGDRVRVQWQKEWVDVDLAEAVAAAAPTGQVTVTAQGEARPRMSDFCVDKVEAGRTRRASFRPARGQGREVVVARRAEWGDGPQDGSDKAPVFGLDAGYYILTTGKRLENGSVLAHLQSFTVRPDEDVEVPFVLRSEAPSVTRTGDVPAEAGTTMKVRLSALGCIDASKVSDKPKFILAVVKENGEPTVHALRQLEGNPDAIILRPGDPSYDRCKLMIEVALGADPRGLPYVIAADAGGNVYYFSQGYNTSLRENLDDIFPLIP